MNPELLDVSPPPTPRARRPKAVKPAIPKDVSKEKVTLCLAADANLKLSIHATGMGIDRSALVERLIREHLRRFVLQDRGEREAAQEGSVGQA